MSTQTAEPTDVSLPAFAAASPPTAENPLLRRFLRAVKPHLPLRESHDILMELESNVLDRVDYLATVERRAPDDGLFRKAIDEMGTPQRVAAAYVQDRYLVAPESFRPFLLYTCMLFAVHLVLIGVATATEKALHVGLFPIAPVGPNGLLSVLAAVSQALLLDTGLTAITFGVAGALQRKLAPQTALFAVQASPRQAGGRLALALLVAAVVAFFRNELFVVVAEGRAHTLVSEWGQSAAPLLVALLVGSALKDVLYVFLNEHGVSLAADAIHGVAGVVLCLYLLSGTALLQIPSLPGSETFREPVNALLAQLGTLLLVTGAVLFAVKTLRRSVRLAQM